MWTLVTSNKSKRAQSHRGNLIHLYIHLLQISQLRKHHFLQIISHIFGNFGVKFLYRLLKYNTKRTRYHVKPHIHLYQLSATCMDKVRSGLEAQADFHRTQLHILVSSRNHSSRVSFVYCCYLSNFSALQCELNPDEA